MPRPYANRHTARSIADYCEIIFKDCIRESVSSTDLKLYCRRARKTVFRLAPIQNQLNDILAGPNLFLEHCLEAAQTLYF